MYKNKWRPVVTSSHQNALCHYSTEAFRSTCSPGRANPRSEPVCRRAAGCVCGQNIHAHLAVYQCLYPRSVKICSPLKRDLTTLHEYSGDRRRRGVSCTANSVARVQLKPVASLGQQPTGIHENRRALPSYDDYCVEASGDELRKPRVCRSGASQLPHQMHQEY